jgi:hypothetical protein
VKTQASTQLAAGVPFMSDTALQEALVGAGVPGEVTAEVVEANSIARIEGMDAALGVLAVLALLALMFTGRMPEAQPTGGVEADEVAAAS